MVHEELTLKRTAGAELFAQCWASEAGPRAVLALVHGFGEHTGRYAHVGEWLARKGFALYGVDLPGHGRSSGRRGVTSRAELLEVTGDLLRDTKARFPGAPVFLYGHSLGGAIALIAALTDSPEVEGVIVTSPLVRLAVPAPAWKVTLARLMASVAPSFTMPNPLVLADLTRDPRMVEAVRGDPLYHNTTSARLGWDIISWEKWFESRRDAVALPLLFMLGAEDRIVDPAAAIALAGRLSGNVTLKVWDGLYHELHNEPEREAVMEYMTSWMGRIAR